MAKQDSVLIFGLDGSTFKILKPLLTKKILPTLTKLSQTGISSILESTIPPMSGAAWATFQTGANPGKHGIFEFIKPSGELINANDVAAPPIWNIIAKHNLTSCIINMPVTYPVKPINGYCISSFLTPPGELYHYPANLRKRLQNIPYQIDLDDPFSLHQKAGEKQKWIKNIYSLAKQRGKACQELIVDQPWNLFFCLFKSVDLMQHLDYDGKATTKLYQIIDQQINDTITTFKRKYPQQRIHTIIMSDHGFHQNFTKDIAFYPLLRQQQLLPTDITYQPVILKLRRLIRRLTNPPTTSGKIISFGMFEKNKQQRDHIVKSLKNIKVEGHKVFKTITTAEKLYGPNYHSHIPDILWITTEYFAPNPDPLSSQLTYPRNSQLKGEHHCDREGILILNSPRLKNKKRKHTPTLQQLTTLVADLLDSAYPGYFEEHPFALQ